MTTLRIRVRAEMVYGSKLYKECGGHEVRQQVLFELAAPAGTSTDRVAELLQMDLEVSTRL